MVQLTDSSKDLDKPRQKREEILAVATRQLCNGGYSELNFKTIAEELATTRANLHYHFDSKEKLALEVISNFAEQGMQQIEEFSSQHSGDFAKLITFMEDTMWQHFTETNGDGFCPCSSILVSQHKVPSSVTAQAEMYYQYMLNLFEEQIRVSQETGKIKSKRNAKDLAKEAQMLVSGGLQMGRAMFSDDLNHSPLRSVIKKWAKNLQSHSS